VNNLLRADRRNEGAASIFHAIPHTGGSFHNRTNHAVYFPACVEPEANAGAYAVVHIVNSIAELLDSGRMSPVTREQIAWNIGIGFVLIIVGAVLHPLLRKAWSFLRKPAPLTPQNKGKLMEQLAFQEQELEKINRFVQSSKDLFLYLFQLSAVGAAFFVLALALGLLSYRFQGSALGIAIGLVFLTMSVLFFALAIRDSYRMADASIRNTKEKIEERIKEMKALLNIPVAP
jgi:hypothetical protein